jgi:flagellar hook-associated protein 2
LSISFGSINTGLPKDIVDQIIKAERIPIENIEKRKTKLGEKKQLIQELTKLVEELKKNIDTGGNARSLREFKVISNEDFVDVTVDKSLAEPGNYQFEVVQLAQKSSAMTGGIEDPEETYLGVGYVQYYLPNGETKDVYIDSENSSLRGIAKLINQDRSSGMRASVVNDGTGSDAPWRLIVSLEDTGDEVNAEFPYFYLVDGEEDLFIEYEREAHDAIVKLDGFEIEVPKNKAENLIPGLIIDLKRAKEGEEFTIQVSEDVEKIAEKVELMVKGINDVLQFIITQNTLDEKTDTSRTLGGDISLQTIESRLRNVMFHTVPTQYGSMRVGDLGITFQRNGLLQLDRNKFEAALADNYKKVAQVLVGYFDEDNIKVEGFVDKLKKNVEGLTKYPDGVLATSKAGMDSKVQAIDRQIATKERMLEQKEKNLKQKFATLEGTISRIRNQGAGLAGLGSAPDPVTQLG